MTEEVSRTKALEVYRKWGEEIGWYYDPVLIPPEDLNSDNFGSSNIGLLIDLIAEAIEESHGSRE